MMDGKGRNATAAGLNRFSISFEMQWLCSGTPADVQTDTTTSTAFQKEAAVQQPNQ